MNIISSRASLVLVSLVVAFGAFLSLPSLTHADTLYRQLDIGASGSDVTALQTYLAQDATIYPEGLVTGYFGLLTSAAVARFQTRNEIEPVGRVGPKTLVALNARMGGSIGTTGDVNAPIIFGITINQGTTSATVAWGTNELARGIVYYGTNPLLMTEVANNVVVSGSAASTDGSFRTSQSVMISALQRNTTYFYVVHATDAFGNVNVTWPSTFRTTQ